MKFLLDMPVSPLLLHVLQAYGHEGIHAYQIGKDRASDSEMCDLLERLLKTVRPEVMERYVCVVDKSRIRITQLPISIHS